MNNEIIILGIGHNSIAYIDLVEDCGYKVKNLLHYNQERNGEPYFDYTITGCFEDVLQRDSLEGMNFALSMGDISIRRELYERIKAKGGNFPTLIHPTAVVSRHSVLGEGVIIMPQSVVQGDVTIGCNTVVTIGSIVSHSTKIGDHCFISGNTIIGAFVQIGNGVQIGQHCNVVSGTVNTIGDNSILGAGSVLRSDMKPDSIYLGNPARFIKLKE